MLFQQSMTPSSLVPREQRGGQEPLVQPSVEFADDQDHVSALELQPDAPRHRMLEEKVLARQAGERFTKASAGYRKTAGYKMSLAKCYSMWNTALCPYVEQRPATLDA
eukprot:COSAG02_NODE_19603_length_873_cov_3.081395_2_plen_108_part_00